MNNKIIYRNKYTYHEFILESLEIERNTCKLLDTKTLNEYFMTYDDLKELFEIVKDEKTN